MEYEEGMEKRDDIIIFGKCLIHGTTQAEAKRYIGHGPEPGWHCPKCGTVLTDVLIEKVVMPCIVCGFYYAQDIGLGNYICMNCIKTWERVDTVMRSIPEEKDDSPTNK